MRIETDGNRARYKYNFTRDPSQIDFYLVRFCAALDCLMAISNHKPEFLEARFEASYKEMLCLYSMLDDMEEILQKIKAENVLQGTKAEGIKASLELLPEFITENE